MARSAPKGGYLKPLPARKGTVSTNPAVPGLPTPGPGRPVSNIGKYLIKPTAELDSGFEMVNFEPDMIKKVHQTYLKAGQLPPALQPKYLRKPEVLDSARAKNISKGWRKPRSQQG